ncbi:hypothetical protein CLOM_g1838 [Closterium sp. NIES-68]|nr:hypothetical protein CLOM_g22630 [Closterium sp. NIES-68]GJP42251.1 hypothetical protein CLOM_g1838 [Closterium sp. NIES-68]GJP73229.1 hypothetical protein CLOP_g3974 [Closterium sp. NIES-67]GJP83458.1 hypothetical protein CLOP_g13605 [Closterium sp. NIES-67]
MTDALASSQPFIATASSTKSSFQIDLGSGRTDPEREPEVEPRVASGRTSEQRGRSDGREGLLRLVSNELDFVTDVVDVQRQQRQQRRQRISRGKVAFTVKEEASGRSLASTESTQKRERIIFLGTVEEASGRITGASVVDESQALRCPQAHSRYRQTRYKERSVVSAAAAAENETRGKGENRTETMEGIGLAIDDYERELRMLKSQVRAMTGAIRGNALFSTEARLRRLMQARKQREVAWFVSTWRRSQLRLNNATWPPANQWTAELAAANRMPRKMPSIMRPHGSMSSSPRDRQTKASLSAMGGADVVAAAVGNGDVAALGRDDTSALGDDDIIIVLYVHNRPAYLSRTLDALSKVHGIQNVLLIVSHDGFYPAMHQLVQSVSFCRVKQLHSPFSPHLFNGTFPAAAPDDCRGKSRRPWETRAGCQWPARGIHEGPRETVSDGMRDGDGDGMVGDGVRCWGQADEFGSYRDPRIVSLKHHWWWLQNTVWDGLPETKSFNGHMLFIEEDHWLFPNALSHLRALLSAKSRGRCDQCIAASLAPADVGVVEDKEGGGGEWREMMTASVDTAGEVEDEEGGEMEDRGVKPAVRAQEGSAVEKGGVSRRKRHFTAERLGNVGYSFNRSVWEMMRGLAEEFCYLDEYNWDRSMWGLISHHMPSARMLRWHRTSAWHFGEGMGMGIGVGMEDPKLLVGKWDPLKYFD